MPAGSGRGGTGEHRLGCAYFFTPRGPLATAASRSALATNEEHTISGCVKRSHAPEIASGRAGRARAYVIMADRLQFHLEAGTLPAEAAEHVRHAQDALMKASAALRRAENEKVPMPETPAKPNVTGL